VLASTEAQASLCNERAARKTYIADATFASETLALQSARLFHFKLQRVEERVIAPDTEAQHIPACSSICAELEEWPATSTPRHGFIEECDPI